MENNVNQRVKLLRTKLGFTQSEFAMRARITVPTLSRLENEEAKVSDKTIKGIVAGINANDEWLRNGKGEMLTGPMPSYNPMSGTQEVANPWKDALVSELRNEVTYLRELLKMAMSKGNANFPKAPEFAGAAWRFNRASFSGVAA